MTFDGTNLTVAGNVSAYSDETLKTDIATILQALDKVNAMRGVAFTRILDNQRGSGVVAQELQKIAPELVIVDADGMLSVAYGNITGYLIEAIKELTARIEAIESRLT
jgi:ribosomal protein RSM22 (predicted rRNA methylase)